VRSGPWPRLGNNLGNVGAADLSDLCDSLRPLSPPCQELGPSQNAGPSGEDPEPPGPSATEPISARFLRIARANAVPLGDSSAVRIPDICGNSAPPGGAHRAFHSRERACPDRFGHDKVQQYPELGADTTSKPTTPRERESGLRVSAKSVDILGLTRQSICSSGEGLLSQATKGIRPRRSQRSSVRERRGTARVKPTLFSGRAFRRRASHALRGAVARQPAQVMRFAHADKPGSLTSHEAFPLSLPRRPEAVCASMVHLTGHSGFQSRCEPNRGGDLSPRSSCPPHIDERPMSCSGLTWAWRLDLSRAALSFAAPWDAGSARATSSD
jgi:hypothetical protein